MKQTVNSLLIVSLVCVVAFFSGCATILSGDTQKINVRTEAGKKYTATIDGQKYTVPSVIEVKRENKDKFFSIDACPDQKVMLRKQIETAFWVNIFSGAFGSTTDYASGSMWKYEPENIDAKCM